MIYCLDNKVFLVNGVKKSLIYDIRDYYANLYWIDNVFFKKDNWLNKLFDLLDISGESLKKLEKLKIMKELLTTNPSR